MGDATYYLSYADALVLHILLMRRHGETRAGAFDPNLVQSALARPRHAAVYENADLIRQAATCVSG
jgi:prophage maintenance system killer protein